MREGRRSSQSHGKVVCECSGWKVTGKSGTTMNDCVNAVSWMRGMCGRSMRALVVARPSRSTER
jgi:hypothetical protein